jgi:hypothetical protein
VLQVFHTFSCSAAPMWKGVSRPAGENDTPSLGIGRGIWESGGRAEATVEVEAGAEEERTRVASRSRRGRGGRLLPFLVLIVGV